MTVTLTPKEKTVMALLFIQPALVLLVLVLQPGFDYPNSLGLDFDFVVLVFGAYVVSWLVGFVLACTLSSRRAVYVCGYFLSPLVCFGLVALYEGVF
jgi:hypothetical protein